LILKFLFGTYRPSNDDIRLPPIDVHIAVWSVSTTTAYKTTDTSYKQTQI
jgi:hypothetical protein